jgi:hypothetical protein
MTRKTQPERIRYTICKILVYFRALCAYHSNALGRYIVPLF